MNDQASSAGLDEEIVQAHLADERHRLCTLYMKAGEIKEAAGEIDAACFLFTQAYVFGLDSDNRKDRNRARAKLVAYGRDR